MLAFVGMLALCASVPLHAGRGGPEAPPPEPSPTSVVIILCDDLGWGDPGCQGGPHPTPAIDRIAAEGVRCTDFYAAQPVCSAARAALLTGCYPNRIGIAGALGPGASVGIAEEELTLAELCRSRGHATALLGKWHLGDAPAFSPLRHGFDEYFGIPYSNDMWPRHPEAPAAYPPLPLLEGARVVDADVSEHDQAALTGALTRRAVEFIERNSARPFLLVLAHPMPHVPLFPGPRFAGSTGRGTYADVIAELDWSTGEILAALDRCGRARDTIVIFTSDNGPWLSYGDHAGSAGPLREGKGTTWEGGVRVPFLLRWPARVPPGSTLPSPAMQIDVLPTIAAALGVADRLADPARPIDGVDLLPWIAVPETDRPSGDPHEALAFYYHRNDLEAVRSGRWKLVLPHRFRTLAGRPGGRGGTPVRYEQVACGLELYDLAADPGERRDLAAEHPEVVARLAALAERFRADLGDDSTRRVGTGRRDPGRTGAPRHPPAETHPDRPTDRGPAGHEQLQLRPDAPVASPP